jgi:Mrp family chromosome partitioning ATPase
MARILDANGRSARTPVTPQSRPPAEIEPSLRDDEAEANDVPFIEVGIPATRATKTSGPRLPIPAIIPLSRPTPRLPDPPPAQAEPTFFHVSFQPLPFPTAPAGAPDQRFAPELVAYHYPDHAASEQYRTFARELEAQLGDDPGKALLFSAAHPQAGTTSVLLNLAITLAKRGDCRVIVVDAQFARPACAARLGGAPLPGLREVLARTVPLVWALQETGLPQLHLLANGQPTREPIMDVWPLVLDQLRQRSDWILIDSPDWGSRPELPALAATCPATYLVLRPDDLLGSTVNDLLSEIPRHGGQLRGYVLAQK